MNLVAPKGAWRGDSPWNERWYSLPTSLHAPPPPYHLALLTYNPLTRVAEILATTTTARVGLHVGAKVDPKGPTSVTPVTYSAGTLRLG
jgi:hypothetical protein